MIKTNESRSKYFYHIAMALLAITNSVFLLYNLKSWKIDIDQTALLLTVIGILFAFGGIYVYSVFNANIDAEKRAINDLQERYKRELEQANKGLLSVHKLMSLYQKGQLIVNAPTISIQQSALVRECELLFNEQKEYLDELSKIPSPTYSAYKSNFDSVCQSISESLDFKIDQIEKKRKQFFADSRFSKTNQDKLLDELKKLYAILISNSNNDM